MLLKSTIPFVEYEYKHRTIIVIIKHIIICKGILILNFIFHSENERPYKMDAAIQIRTDFKESFSPLSSISIGTNIIVPNPTDRNKFRKTLFILPP